MPIVIQEELQGANDSFQSRGRSVFAEMIEQELVTGSRIVFDSPLFLAFCPYASRFPFETWILPKTHNSHFEKIASGDIDQLGRVLKAVLKKFELVLDNPPYNYVFHTAPFNMPELPYYSWHIEIFPRMTRIAGFEWGSGFFINPVYPEEAARKLREMPV